LVIPSSASCPIWSTHAAGRPADDRAQAAQEVAQPVLVHQGAIGVGGAGVAVLPRVVLGHQRGERFPQPVRNRLAVEGEPEGVVGRAGQHRQRNTSSWPCQVTAAPRVSPCTAAA
jgi:hypothetical protein